MTRRTFLLGPVAIGAALLALAVVPACEEAKREPSTPVDRLEVLRALTANVFVPSARELDQRADALREATASLAAAPSAGALEGARSAWRAARLAYEESVAFGFGPAGSLRVAAALDWFPASPAAIEGEIAGDAALDATYVASLGAASKGLTALEYLLFDAPGGDAAVLEKLSGDAAEALRRRAYVAALGEQIAEKTGELSRAWGDGEGGFAKEVSSAGVGSEVFPTQKEAMDAVLNQLLFVSQSVTDAQLAKPMGLHSGGAPQPALVPSASSDHGPADIAAELRGIEHVYAGAYRDARGLGLGDVVREAAPDVDARFRGELAAAIAAAEAIPRPMAETATWRPGDLQSAYDAARAVKRTLATEISTLVGATIGFNDNDGD